MRKQKKQKDAKGAVTVRDCERAVITAACNWFRCGLNDSGQMAAEMKLAVAVNALVESVTNQVVADVCSRKKTRKGRRS